MQSIIKIPLTDNIAAHTGVHENRGPTFYDPYFHYGDPTYSRETGHEGLFVPIETLEDSPHFVYISYHTPSLDTFYVNDQLAWSYSNLAWIAINPADGLLYLPSTYSEITQLDAYAIQWTGNGYQFTLQLVRHLQLRDQNGNNLTPSTSPLRAVQGGEFSSNGHLYMSSWDCNNPSNGGIYGFDTNGILYQHIPAIYSAGCGGLDDELEGIDILDLGSGGQIHVTKIDNNWPSDDQLFFMHFGVNAATRSKL
jgi:hypothetical protein